MILGYRTGIKTLCSSAWRNGIELHFKEPFHRPFHCQFMVTFEVGIENKNSNEMLYFLQYIFTI